LRNRQTPQQPITQSRQRGAQTTPAHLHWCGAYPPSSWPAQAASSRVYALKYDSHFGHFPAVFIVSVQCPPLCPWLPHFRGYIQIGLLRTSQDWWVLFPAVLVSFLVAQVYHCKAPRPMIEDICLCQSGRFPLPIYVVV